MSTVETRSKKAKGNERSQEEDPGNLSTTDITLSIEPTTSINRTVITEETCNTERTEETEQSQNTRQHIKQNNRKKTMGLRTSNSKRAELEALLEFQKREKQKADAAAEITRIQLELLRLADRSDFEQEEQPIDLVNDTIEQTYAPPINNSDCNAHKTTALSNFISKAQECANQTTTNQDLATRKPPTYMSDLHTFDGDPINWIPFISHYRDTAPFFSDIENIARIRRSLKGSGRDAVKSLLYTSTSPEKVLIELERRFGQPTYIIKREIAELDRLTPMSEDIKDIGAFASTVFNSVNTIKQLNRVEYLYSTDVSDRIVNKMSPMIKFRWQEYKTDRTTEPILIVLTDFLNKVSEQFYEPSFNTKTKNRPPRSISKRVNVTNYIESDIESDYDSELEEEMKLAFAASVSEKSCIMCEKPHDITVCSQFLNQTIRERWETVKTLKMCFKCLETTHRHNLCKSRPCNKNGCTRNHHELLHFEKSKPETNKIVSVNHVGTSRAYLKIIPVEVCGPCGTETVLALLDEGSTVTLLTEDVANRIGAAGPSRSLLIEGIGGHQMKSEESKHIKIRIKGLFSRHYEDLRANTIERLNLISQSVTKEDVEDCPHLTKIADQLIYDGSPPSLLIGQDNWHLIVTREIKAGSASKPVASLTRLGWILHGCKTDTTKPLLCINHMYDKRNDTIEELIKDHFNLDSIGIAPRKPTNDPEQRALEILEKTTRRLPEGRFECGLLWRTDNDTMPPNRGNALRRLKGVERKLLKNNDLRTQYNEQIKNLLASGYAEPVTTQPTSPRTWYLPHFAVIHPQKGKLRLVFDAADRTNGKCLNDALLSGPDLLQSLFGVLVRFRQGPIAIAADIKEMFLRIVIREEDRDSLRFLWKENETDVEPKEYRMKSLIFGATSSPCTAIYVKNRNAQDFQETYPQAVRAIQRCHYMDDYLQSFDTVEEALKISREVDFIHKNGGFQLRGWTSNQPAAIQSLENDQPYHINLGDHDKYGKTLGLLWQTNSDTLSFTVNLRNTPEEVKKESRPPTKREVASAVMSIFDPLGLATPVLIQGKILMQQLWRTGIEWDEYIPEALQNEWSKWLENIQLLKELSIPRCTDSQHGGELHTFVDASENIYAAATYWKTTFNGQTIVKLIAAKAKVAPLKPISIPRLELQAALLGCRLAEAIKSEMDNPIEKKYYWSDSRTVLAWIKSDPRTFKSFVAHRLAEIEELSKPLEWRYVPTKHNVADDATKSSPRNFNKNHRWFSGPVFLARDPKEWPVDQSATHLPPTGEERALTTTIIKQTEMPIPDVKRFSSWTRLLRATARVLQITDRFKSLIRPLEASMATKQIIRNSSRKHCKYHPPEHLVETTPLPNKYIERAERLLIQNVQNESFGAEINELKKNDRIQNGSRLKRFAVIMIDDIMRIETRLTTARNLAASYKKPIILDGKHPITRLIISYYHREYNHGSHHTVMNEIRQKYYVTSLRNSVRAIARECQWCKTHKAIPAVAPMGDLPPERLQRNQHPFTCTAVDYFGPVIITVGRRTEKRWIALFTCLTTRAIHLEIATSLSANHMLMALRRMIARRGTPATMYSDNGTNFIKADKELKTEFNKIKIKIEEKGIQWKFIPPGAPHMGGAWERLVRTVKSALAATLNARHPHEEVLHTLLLEAEHLVNSRPITEVSLDPDEQEALTPNHFLIGRSSGARRMGDFTDAELSGKTTWRTVQRLADHFWKRWLNEYLPLIAPRYNNGPNNFTNPTIGDVVIIVDNSLPRGTWPKGEVTNVYPGPDGKVRIVDVRTIAGTLRRPASRLIRIAQSSAHMESA